MPDGPGPEQRCAIAVVPARGGSKRLPRKNLALLHGKPLVAWAVESASRAQHVARVIVSTDDPEIAEVARAAGAEVPWLRPPELAADDTPTVEVVRHAVAWALESTRPAPELCALLEPTAPLRPPGIVDEVLRALHDDRAASSAATVCEVPHTLNPDEQLVIRDGALDAFASGTLDERRLRGAQRPTFVFSGQVYATRVATVAAGSLFGDRCIAVPRPWHELVDVDDAADLETAATALRRAGLAPH